MEINPSEYKILIVDDVMSNVLLLKVLLTNEKFAIATASNGRQALELVDEGLGLAIFAKGGLVDIRAQGIGHGLEAVADAQYGNAGL